jgi:hypothetical protein
LHSRTLKNVAEHWQAPHLEILSRSSTWFQWKADGAGQQQIQLRRCEVAECNDVVTGLETGKGKHGLDAFAIRQMVQSRSL